MANNSSAQAPSLSEILAQLSLEEAGQDTANDDCESALTGTVQSLYTISNFEAFLMRSHCEENFEFWKNCNFYLENFSRSGFSHTAWSKKVYETFIEENAPMECNLPEKIRKLFTEWYRNGSFPDTDTILKAKLHAIDLMSDAYRRFIKSASSSISTSTLASVATTASTSRSVTISVADTTNIRNKHVTVKKVVRSSQPGSHDAIASFEQLSSITKTTLKDASKSTESLSSMVAVSSHESANDADIMDLPAVHVRSNSSGTHNFIDKGIALVTKLKKKKLRPRLTSSPSSSSSNVPFHSHFKNGEIS